MNRVGLKTRSCRQANTPESVTSTLQHSNTSTHQHFLTILPTKSKMTMEKQTRRAFVASALAVGATTTAAAIPFKMEKKPQLAHHVFFWLKNPDSKEDLNKLIEGLKT